MTEFRLASSVRQQWMKPNGKQPAANRLDSRVVIQSQHSRDSAAVDFRGSWVSFRHNQRFESLAM